MGIGLSAMPHVPRAVAAESVPPDKPQVSRG
jgi:hypothetical protein